MWNLGNRDIIVLVSVISGCAILFNVWGAFYALTITLLLVFCGWLTIVIIDDTPLTPHALLALNYLEEAAREIDDYLKKVYQYIHVYFTFITNVVKRFYRIHIHERMAQRRRSAYQLSAETYPNTVNSTFALGLSPISRGNHRTCVNNSNVENSPYVESSSSRILQHSGSSSKVTSTPMPWRKEEIRNGDIFQSDHLGASRSTWTKYGSSSSLQNHTSSRGEDVTYNESSPWGTSISPKMRSRAAGVKTVQTVAGPLLASTRYNIDPKVYSDVTSPGLTSRLTKYATEANTKLTHQSQYGTGQFPRVNLNSSPTPLINTKTGKMRTPVTVRVAPPESTRYSPPERQKILSDICHAEIKSSPSVVQVLKEISLKRHASREDVTFELAKKQRTEGVFSDGLENLEEMTQKRTRDDSSRSEEEISPQNKSLRPAKRTKMPSCHDILSSLSSSINFSSGVKRKAIDISRSGTPDLGKHFKSLDSSHGDGLSQANVNRTIVEQTKSNKRSLNDLETSRSSEIGSPNKKLESVGQKGILQSVPNKQIVNNSSGDANEKLNRVTEEREVRNVGENAVQAVKLTDRLFMKAEPQNIDKLKTLIEEHGSIKPRFVTNESDEIKKSDIVNMRKTSMKTRLKSMFDAISGKAPNAINPEVVIQAEEPKSSTISLPITASLSSTTSTTNVNTSPIATSAIVPIIGKTKPRTTPAKHVTFQFTTSDTNAKTDSVESSQLPIVETNLTSASVSEPNKIETPAISKPATNTIFQPFDTPSTTSSAFSFGISLKTTKSPTTNVIPASVVVSTISMSVPSTANVTATTSPPQFSSTQNFNASTTTSSVFGNSTITKNDATAIPNFNNVAQVSEKNSQPQALSFSFSTTTSAPTLANTQSTLFPSTQSQGFAAPTTTTATASSVFAMPNKTTVTQPAFSVATTNTTTSMFSFGDNATSQTTDKKAFTFGGTCTNNVVNTTTSQSGLTTIAPAQPASGNFSFSAVNSAPMKNNIFGTVPTTSSTTSVFPATTDTAVFSFGSNVTSTSKPNFAFGSNTTTISTAATTAAPSITFGATTNTATPLFGAPAATTTATTSAAAQQSSIFGTLATNAGGFANNTIATTFGTTNQPSFSGTTNTANTFGTPKTMETPTFGTNTASSSFVTASSASNLFGGGVHTNTTSTNPPTAFGTGGFGETKAPPAFGVNATPSFTANSGTSLFASQTTNNPSFGTTNPTTSGTTSLFGTSSTNAPTFGTSNTAPPPAFGATNTATTTTFGASITSAPPAFGTTNTATPTFGLQSSVTVTNANQNSTSSAFSVTSPAFGAVTTTAPPAFGTISAPSGFGNTGATSGFGTSNNPPPAFSSSNTSFSGFGGAPNVASPFGSQATPAASNFGTPSSVAPTFGTGNANNSSFTFGAAQPTAQQPQQPQQSGVFAFGGATPASGNNTASANAPFQFGNPAPQTGGFNFSGASSVPALNFSRDGASASSFTTPAIGANAFNAPPATGGMFSIGSGSTGPRSRPSRRRQR